MVRLGYKGLDPLGHHSMENIHVPNYRNMYRDGMGVGDLRHTHSSLHILRKYKMAQKLSSVYHMYHLDRPCMRTDPADIDMIPNHKGRHIRRHIYNELLIWTILYGA